MTEQFPGQVPEDFDAFRPAETQPAQPHPGYSFPYQEPDPTMVFEPIAPAPAPAPQGWRQRIGGMGKAKLAAAGAAAVVVIGGGAWAASSAFASSPGSPAAASAPQVATSTPTPSAPTKGARGKTGVKAVRLTITQVGTSSFTGTDIKGQTVTVTYGDTTKFGNKVHPLSPDQLTAGMVVTVLGERSGASITATNIAAPVKKGGGKGPGPQPSATPGQDNNG
jgi:hypothetical protein